MLENEHPCSSILEQPESVLEIKEEQPVEKRSALKRSLRESVTEEEAPVEKRPRKPKTPLTASAPPIEGAG
jgi:hypothetical protein